MRVPVFLKAFCETEDGSLITVPFSAETALTAEDPDITLSAEDRPIGGLGIFMVKKSMDEVSYEYKDGKNRLTIKKSF